jgi:cytoskeletal protein CcmA (bactofilin family)
MQKLKSNRIGKIAKNEKGSALIGVLTLAVVMAVASVSYLQVSASIAKNRIVQLHDIRAFQAAEAGMMLGVRWLAKSDNCEEAADLFAGYRIEDVVPGFSLDGVSVQVDIVRTSCCIRVEATANSASTIGYNKIIMQDVFPICGGIPFDTTAFDYAIVCGGDFDFRGCGSITSGAQLHANGEVDVNGSARANLDVSSSVKFLIGNRTLDGSVTAPAFDIHKKAVITGEITMASVDEVAIPDIDLYPWYEVALENGEVHNGFSSSSSCTPEGGVLWVNGDVQLSGGPGTTFTGMIIATGNVHISGQVNVVAPADGFAIASRDGDITITTSGTIDGLIYAKSGNYSQTANGNAQGQLIIKGNIRKGGSSDIVAFRKSIPTVPGGGDSVERIMGSWKESNVVP